MHLSAFDLALDAMNDLLEEPTRPVGPVLDLVTAALLLNTVLRGSRTEQKVLFAALPVLHGIAQAQRLQAH